MQSFKSSLRRTCVWYGDSIDFVVGNSSLSPDILNQSYAQNLTPGNVQFCGGYVAMNGSAMPYLLEDLATPGPVGPKGFLCPQRSLCVEGTNPYNGTVSFDNVLQSLELVFVVITANTFTDLLYYLTDSDYLATALCEAQAFPSRMLLIVASFCCWHCYSDPVANKFGTEFDGPAS